MSKKGPRAVTPRDAEIGRRIRIRRMEIGLSQGELGEALGVTFQQVQKYEKGANRVSLNRVDQLAAALRVPSTYFLEAAKDAAIAADGFLAEALADRDAVELLRAFASIDDPRHRHLVLELARGLVADGGKRRKIHAGAIANGRGREHPRRLHG